jgi:multisubunit Na+/H+ antiporter MnhC subunit
MSELMLASEVLSFLHAAAIFVFIIGLLCFFVHRDYIRQIIGFKLMLQGICLGFIVSGWEQGRMDLSQSMVISALIVEAIVIGLALTMIIHITHHPERERDFFSSFRAARTDDE